MGMTEKIKETICSYVSEDLRFLLSQLPIDCWERLQEIRLRAGKPLNLIIGGSPFFFRQGALIENPYQSDIFCSQKMLNDTVLFISHHSFYALEQEFQHGFVTIPGGHRVGIGGKGVLREGRLQTLKEVSALNIRIARSLPGIADSIMPYLVRKGQVQSTLIIGSPGCGKTTLLREIARTLSEGWEGHCLQVGIIDERSEIGCCYQGIPQLEVGPCTDILDGVPKALGMERFLRVMGHDVVVTDEISTDADCEAVWDLCGCGVAVIASAHGGSLREVQARKSLGQLLERTPFDCYVVLSKRQGVGTIEGVYDDRFCLVREGISCG